MSEHTDWMIRQRRLVSGKTDGLLRQSEARMSEIELPEPHVQKLHDAIAAYKTGMATYGLVQRALDALLAAERAEAERLRDVLETLAAQSSGVVGSTSRADCMAAMAAAAIRRG